MPTSLNGEYLEVLSNVNPDWLIYATGRHNFFDQRNFSKIKNNTCIGVRLQYNGVEKEILFKHILVSLDSPQQLKKTLKEAQQLNECEASEACDDIQYFLSQDVSRFTPPHKSPTYPELKNDLKNE